MYSFVRLFTKIVYKPAIHLLFTNVLLVLLLLSEGGVNALAGVLYDIILLMITRKTGIKPDIQYIFSSINTLKKVLACLFQLLVVSTENKIYVADARYRNVLRYRLFLFR